MSNLVPCFHHIRIQTAYAKYQGRNWWRDTTVKEKFQDVFLGPGFFSIVLIVVATYCNAFMSVYVDQTFPHDRPWNEGAATLPDRLYNILPYWNSRTTPNICLYILIAVCFVRWLPFWNGMSWRKSITLYRRFLLLESLVQLIRSLAMGSTSSPPPDPNCVKVAFGNIFKEGWNLISGSAHTCGDEMFSGHTGLYTLCALFWTFYSQGEEFNMCMPRMWYTKNVAPQEKEGNRGEGVNSEATTTSPRATRAVRNGNNAMPHPADDASLYEDETVSFTSPTPLNWPPARRGYHMMDFLAWGIIIFISILLIWTRYHYTADVFVGFLVAQGLFRIYHLTLEQVEWKLRHVDCQRDTLDESEELPSLTRWTIPERFVLWFEQSVVYKPRTSVAELRNMVVAPNVTRKSLQEYESNAATQQAIQQQKAQKKLAIDPKDSFEQHEVDIENQKEEMRRDRWTEYEREKEIDSK